MNRQEYNGWTNYETWLANLWLTNDPWSMEESMSRAEEGVEEFREWLEEYVWLGLGIEEGGEVPACMAADLIKAGLGEVDIEEVRQSFLADS